MAILMTPQFLNSFFQTGPEKMSLATPQEELSRLFL